MDNHVIEKVPVCMNTFRKMMKEDVTDFPKWAKAYKERCQEHHLKQLQQLCTSSVDYLKTELIEQKRTCLET